MIAYQLVSYFQTEVSTSYDPVGFTAYTDTYHTCDNSVNFEGVITNVGGAYDTVGSSFTCPYRGVYMFSVSVKVCKNDLLITVLKIVLFYLSRLKIDS